MLPGEVQSDEQAFRQILGRLESDVGTILKLIPKGKEMGLFPGTAPFWALARMMFPIAESMGDLIYRHKSTEKNLREVLKNEFEAVRAGYQGKAATLVQLFRHSLTHTDELRSLKTRGRKVSWLISWDEQNDHLKVKCRPQKIFVIHFDTTAFYEDLVAVCKKAMSRQEKGEVKKRYNEWLNLDLDTAKSTPSVKAAIDEIAKLKA